MGGLNEGVLHLGKAIISCRTGYSESHIEALLHAKKKRFIFQKILNRRVPRNWKTQQKSLAESQKNAIMNATVWVSVVQMKFLVLGEATIIRCLLHLKQKETMFVLAHRRAAKRMKEVTGEDKNDSFFVETRCTEKKEEGYKEILEWQMKR